MKLPKEIEDQRLILSGIEEIRSDNTSGAVELSIKAAETLTLLTENFANPSARQLTDSIGTAAKALAAAQPAMASIFNLANRTLCDIDKVCKTEEIRQVLRASCRDFTNQLKSAGRAIADVTLQLIQNDTTIITHSYSSTVLKSLLLAKAKGVRFDVICTES